MNYITRSFALILICILLVMTGCNKVVDEKPSIAIGVSDDMSGLIVNYLADNTALGKNYQLKPFIIKDCCAKTSQIALYSNVLSMAIICKDASKQFLIGNENFVNMGTIFRSTEAIVIGNDDVKKVGATQNKFYDYDLIKEIYPNAEIDYLKAQDLPYALESKQVDAIIMDILSCMKLERELYIPWENDYDTFDLVVSKEYLNSKEYKDFEKFYNEAVEILNNDKEELVRHIEKYVDIEQGEIKEWKVKILTIPSQ